MQEFTFQNFEAEIIQRKEEIFSLRNKPYYIHGFAELLHRFFELSYSPNHFGMGANLDFVTRVGHLLKIFEKEGFERFQQFNVELAARENKKTFIEQEIARIDSRFSRFHGCYYGQTQQAMLYLFSIVEYFDPALRNLISKEIDGTGLIETSFFELKSDLDFRHTLINRLIQFEDEKPEKEARKAVSKKMPKPVYKSWEALFHQDGLLGEVEKIMHYGKFNLLTTEGTFIDQKGNKVVFWAIIEALIIKGWIPPVDQRTLAKLAGKKYDTHFDPSYRRKAKISKNYDEILWEAKQVLPNIPLSFAKVGDNADNRG